jgi:hypothetical protein
MMATMKPVAGLIAVMSFLLVCAGLPARGQQCPTEDGPSEAKTLEGKLIYHDGLRKWFELKLARPECGQESVELLQGGGALAPGSPAELEPFRGCRVRTKGVLCGPASGYYTLDLNQGVEEIEAVGECKKQPPFPDFSKAKPDKSIRSYRVGMTIDYKQADHPIFFHVISGGKELQPWQAYASYWLTGGYVLYGYCAKSFAVDRVFGDAEATPQHFEERGNPIDAAMFDPEGAAGNVKKKLQLGYTCTRIPEPGARK